MIEFKAECGHTVRAKDDEAGGLVRCSYCGKSSNVPQGPDEALDSLFDELEHSSSAVAKAGAAAARGARPKRGRRPGAFNPFPIILRMCYAALLVSIVVVLVNKFVIPIWKGSGRAATATTPTDPPVKKQRITSDEPSKPPDKGLLNRSHATGLYVVSTPPGASVFCISAADAPAAGRIHRLNGCTAHGSAGSVQRISDGTYVVEVAFAWNDQALKRYHGYSDFRRALERAPESQRNKMVEDFFVPDEASAVLFDPTEEQKYIVRQYRNIEVRDGKSGGVRGLFLPRVLAPDESFQIEEIVVRYLPEGVQYGFDERHVREELEYYGVKEIDQPWMVQALSRIGIMPYAIPSKRLLVFKIGVEDGTFSARTIREFGR
jgi:hypothetical protein